MKHTIHSIFQALPIPDISIALKDRILHAIVEEQSMRAQRERAWLLVGFLASAGFLVGAVGWYGSALVRSDFWSIVSLLFSDADVVLAYSGHFLYSLLETFPVIPVIAFLIPTLVLLLLGQEYVKFRGSFKRLSLHL